MTLENSSTNANKVLLIGSPRSMKDGSYTQLITRFDNQVPSRIVQKELCDRIADGATNLAHSEYSEIHLIVDLQDLSSSSQSTLSDFLKSVLPSIQPFGNLTWQTKSDQSAIIESALKESSFMVDIQVSHNSDKSQIITGTRSSISNTNSVAINLPKKAHKASLWSFTNTTEDELIDDSKLLTEEDLEPPTNKNNNEACNPKKAKRACKNCTCELRELELSGEDDLPNDLKVSQPNKLSVDSNKLVVNAIPKTFTSSCGSCYLGDAFRCSSCPYLGMPAFEPGQKVQLTMEMGDDIPA